MSFLAAKCLGRNVRSSVSTAFVARGIALPIPAVSLHATARLWRDGPTGTAQRPPGAETSCDLARHLL
eukprot:scaffold8123_cov66-Phaeocystis_antarctica.AAC.21